MLNVKAQYGISDSNDIDNQDEHQDHEQNEIETDDAKEKGKRFSGAKKNSKTTI